MAGQASEKRVSSSQQQFSMTALRAKISERYNRAKETWRRSRHGVNFTPPPRPKSCLDKAKNGIARVASQILSAHWTSAIYLKRFSKRATDRHWHCPADCTRRMTRSHVPLHCSNARIVAARQQAWEGILPRSIWVLLADSRWQRRLLVFLELSGVGRIMDNGKDADAQAESVRAWSD